MHPVPRALAVLLLGCTPTPTPPVDGGAEAGGDADAACVPADELCNGLDDDCDDAIDEPPASAACALAHATASCTAGECAVLGCDDGYDDCDGLAGTGCEADLGSPETCGACDVACDGDQFCSGGACVDQLPREVVAGANFTCARSSSGRAYCWGANAEDQLGDGSGVTDRSEPGAPVASSAGTFTDVVGLVAGAAHACALRANGELWCWGKNTDGQVGKGSVSTTEALAVKAGSLANVVRGCAGSAHTCALTASGAVSCWGDNASGQLGTGGTADAATPTGVGALSGVPVEELACGDDFTCALAGAGTVHCWGAGAEGQLGDGLGASSAVPVLVSGIGDADAITAGVAHACARAGDGQLYCWGANDSGQLGLGASSATPTLAPLTAASLEGGGAFTPDVIPARSQDHVCVVELAGGGDRKVYCWGDGASGRLGIDETTADRPAGAQVSSLGSVSSVALGLAHTCALERDGILLCWGSNTDGQLGSGARAVRRTPNRAELVTLPGL